MEFAVVIETTLPPHVTRFAECETPEHAREFARLLREHGRPLRPGEPPEPVEWVRVSAQPVEQVEECGPAEEERGGR